MYGRLLWHFYNTVFSHPYAQQEFIYLLKTQGVHVSTSKDSTSKNMQDKDTEIKHFF